MTWKPQQGWRKQSPWPWQEPYLYLPFSWLNWKVIPFFCTLFSCFIYANIFLQTRREENRCWKFESAKCPKPRVQMSIYDLVSGVFIEKHTNLGFMIFSFSFFLILPFLVLFKEKGKIWERIMFQSYLSKLRFGSKSCSTCWLMKNLFALIFTE